MRISWGAPLIQSIVEWTDRGRMRRGDDLYRSGDVERVGFSPGEVSGAVIGTSDTYLCSLSVDVLSSGKVSYLRSFLSNLPANPWPVLAVVDQAFAAKGAWLGPAPDDAPDPWCECPDPEEFCKHVVALTLACAELIDDDPSLWLVVRGLEPSEETLPTPAEPEPPAALPEPSLEQELATYWTGSGDVPAVAGTVRPAHRERDRDELVAGLIPEFSVQGRSRAKAVDLARQATDAIGALFVDLTSAPSTVPLAREPVDGGF